MLIIDSSKYNNYLADCGVENCMVDLYFKKQAADNIYYIESKEALYRYYDFEKLKFAE